MNVQIIFYSKKKKKNWDSVIRCSKKNKKIKFSIYNPPNKQKCPILHFPSYYSYKF